MQNNHLQPVTAAQALVVCIGNELVADDAVGHAVFTQLAELGLPGNVRLEYCGVGGIALLELLTGQEELMIVVDAVQLGDPIGTVRLWSWDELPVLEGGSAISAHGIGLKDTLVIGRTLYPERMPRQILLVGVEGRCFDQLGSAMSPEVAAAVPLAVAAICKELNLTLLPNQAGDQP